MKYKQGMYFEDLEPGSCVETSTRTITAEDIDVFAKLSGDFHPLHLNESYAVCTAFGGRIAQGALILSIATGLAYSSGYLKGTIDAFAELHWKYRAPVRINDVLHAEMTVINKRKLPNTENGLVTIKVRMINQNDEVVQDGKWTLMIRSANATPIDMKETH